MTPYELAQIRVKCVEIFVVPCSKVGLEADVAFDKGAKLFDIVKREIAEYGKGQVERPQYQKK